MQESADPSVLVFVNSRSGGGQGLYLKNAFQKGLSEGQVIDLDKDQPKEALEKFASTPNLRVIVAGGDGTVGWVLSLIDELKVLLYPRPPVSIVPLGTGNDLSRCLGWGKEYNYKRLPTILEETADASIVLFDRWNVAVEETQLGITQTRKHVMNNYMSIGIDAKVALNFHKMRNAYPELYFAASMNKFWYFCFGCVAIWDRLPYPLNGLVKIKVDGKQLDLPHDCEGIMILNIPLYGGGADPWGRHTDQKFKKPEVDDGLVEVCAITGAFHLGAITTHTTTAIRLAQGSDIEIDIESDTPVPFQVDGEPRLQDRSKIHVTQNSQAFMLQKDDMPSSTTWFGA